MDKNLFPADVVVGESLVDRKDWPRKDGPWNQEPDRIQWRDPETGSVCLIKRNAYGGLCGYVGVAPGHPWHNLNYMGLIGVQVHGGLTYSDHCQDDPINGICHVPNPGEADHLYWLGFDCGHSFDLCPNERSYGGKYRDVKYVRDEVTNLAKQAKEAEINV